MTKVEPYPYSSFEKLPSRASQAEEAFLAVTEQQSHARKESEEQSYRRGYDEGKKEGIAQGETEREQLRRMVLATQQSIERSLASFERRFTDMLEAKVKDTVTLAGAIARKVAGEALQAFPEQKALGCIRQCLHLIYRDFQLTVFIHNDVLEPFKARLSEIMPESQCMKNITLQGNKTIPAGDCRIEWNGGQAESSTAMLWQEIEKVLQQISSNDTQGG